MFARSFFAILYSLLAVSSIANANTNRIDDSTLSKQSVIAIESFVSKYVSISNCYFNKSLIRNSLSLGLARVNALNPKLAKHIIEEGLSRPLSIVCDVPVTKKSRIYYEGTDDSIHLWVVKTKGNIEANFFHEFLHFYGLEHLENPPADDSIFYTDEVYACHLSGFPEVAKAADIDDSILSKVKEKCSQVKPAALNGAGYTY